jgi:hypothetical protein
MTYRVDFAVRAARDLEILYKEKNAAESHDAARWYNGSLRLVEDQADRLNARIGCTPPSHVSCDQPTFHRVFLLFRCDLNHGYSIKVQPTLVERRVIPRIWSA